jgi:glycerophosphoryl diester phosphodiesterase
MTRSEKAKEKSSRMQTHDAFATLREALRVVPAETGFLIEVKYPTDAYQRLQNIRYPERNVYADAVLKEIFDGLAASQASRPVILISFDPSICTLLAAKQPRYPVMFVIGCGDIKFGDNEWTKANPDIDPCDPRNQSIENAVAFAKKGMHNHTS